MKKPYLTLLMLLMFFTLTATAQKKITDSLYKDLKKANTDTTRFNALIGLDAYYYIAYPDSAIILGQQAYELAEKHDWTNGEARTYNGMANAYGEMGDYVNAMQYYLKAQRTYESLKNAFGVAQVDNNIGATYVEEQDYIKATPYLNDASRQMNILLKTQKNQPKYARLNDIILENIGENFLDLHQIDSADHYLKICYNASIKDHIAGLIEGVERDLGEVQEANNDRAGALGYFRKSIAHSIAIDDIEGQSIAYLSTANLYHKYKTQDSAEYYAKKALDVAASAKLEQDALNAGKALYAFYDEDHNLPEAYKYFKLTTAAKDSLFSQDKVKQLLSLDFEEKQRRRDIEEARLAYQDQVRTYLFIAGLAILLLIAFIFWRNGRQRQKANRLLKQQKADIESALAKLKLAQTQLVQTEKMASLGELTAGIAHEIQNPLNFVNNFSEVNTELIDEMQQEIDLENYAEVKAIAQGIKENQQKISIHGKRADFIVKGMLQHSRTSTGEKQETNINILADEFLKLSYHGLRAKDKNFNAELTTNFDEKLPKVNIAQQDIGRVLLNLFNNAFYAVNQKKKNKRC